MPHACGGERRDERAALVGGDGGEALAQAPVAGVDPQLPSRLRIHEPQLADVGELLFARIADLDGEHCVASGEPEERRPPVDRTAKVGDDDHQGALLGHPVGQLEGFAERPGPGRGQIAEEAQRVEQSRAGPGGGARRPAPLRTRRCRVDSRAAWLRSRRRSRHPRPRRPCVGHPSRTTSTPTRRARARSPTPALRARPARAVRPFAR